MAPDDHALRDRIGAFFTAYGRALGASDLDVIVASWDVPALVLSDEGAIPVSAPSQIEAFFGQAAARYRQRGMVATEHELLHVDPITDRLVSADVRWSNLDAEGKARGSETSRYVLRIDEQGQPRIRVAIAVDTGS